MTSFFGVISWFILLFLLVEPARGASESETASNQQSRRSFWEDMAYLCRKWVLVWYTYDVPHFDVAARAFYCQQWASPVFRFRQAPLPSGFRTIWNIASRPTANQQQGACFLCSICTTPPIQSKFQRCNEVRHRHVRRWLCRCHVGIGQCHKVAAAERQGRRAGVCNWHGLVPALLRGIAVYGRGPSRLSFCTAKSNFADALFETIGLCRRSYSLPLRSCRWTGPS